MKDKSKSFKTIVGWALSAVLLVGVLSATGAASAATISSSPSKASTVVTSQRAKVTDTAASENGEKETVKKEDPAKESAEDAALSAQAKITKEQAINTAKAANPGTTAAETSIQNENGKAVYEVKLTSANGKISEVKIDANSGAVVSAADENVQYEG